MKLHILTVATALVAFTGATYAADMVTEPAPQPPMAPAAPVVYDWTGAYIGLQGGYVFNNIDNDPLGVDEDFDGPSVGAHAGYNWQSGSFVFGIEGDINYTWDENTYLGGVDIGTDWEGSLRGRFGYAIDRTLLYATAGGAITNGYIDGPGIDENETMTGWTAGAGIEHAFTQNWTARLEYRYTDYGSEDFGLGVGDFDLTEHAVRVGVSYKF